MLKGDFNLGGEQSGHLIFRDSATTGDGILAALHVLEIMVTEQRRVSELRKCMQRLPQVLKNFTVKERVPIEKMPRIAQLIAAMEHKLGKDGRVLFRYSGTEKVARIMIEGQNADQIETMASELCQEASVAIANFQGVDL